MAKKKGVYDSDKQVFEIEVGTVLLGILTGVSALYIFTANHKNLTFNCSYLDPAIVDVLALLGSIFLIVDGLIAIHAYPHVPFSRQVARLVRVLFGSAILTIHILQVAYG